MEFNFNGLFIGLFMILFTGLGHIIVIKGEYHFSIKIWPLFLVLGITCIAASLIFKNFLISSFLGIAGFTLLWGILEIFKQKERVEKGWFPKKNKN